jgi:superfamily II DNA/RNA helicase
MASSTTTESGAGSSTYYTKFSDMPLKKALLRGIYAYGFEKPSDIQSKAICEMASGKDILAQAQSGTGKTGTFTIALLQQINELQNMVQGIIVCHTRELAAQTAKVVSSIGQFMDVRVYVAVGGVDIKNDIDALRPRRSGDRTPQVLVVTPGRLYDLVRRNIFDRSSICSLICDEADQLLSGRFKEQIYEIFRLGWPKTMQVALFSATMVDEVRDVTKKFLNPDHSEFLLEADEVSLEGIKQYYLDLDKEEEKLPVLMELYEMITVTQVVIFVNTKEKAEYLVRVLRENKFSANCIHGGMSTEERNKYMDMFRKSEIRILISTDLISRGIDVQSISLVINYDLPTDRENYIHRIGRSGRYGRKGVSINLILTSEMSQQAEIEKFYDIKIDPLPGDVDKIHKW